MNQKARRYLKSMTLNLTDQTLLVEISTVYVNFYYFKTKIKLNDYIIYNNNEKGYNRIKLFVRHLYI